MRDPEIDENVVIEPVFAEQQFVNARMLVDTLQGATVVPTAAIQRGTQGTFVYIVKEDMTAQLQPVKVARTMGDTAVIASGLLPGQKVVTDGQLRIVPGGKVDIKSAS